MLSLIPRINRHFMLGVLSALICCWTIGCNYFPESTFVLANTSRLPKWLSVPSGHARNDISATLSYYTYPSGRKARFILQDANKRVLEQVDGKVDCTAAFTLKNSSQGITSDYPAYEAITVDGVTEIVIHRKMEPLF